MDAKKRNEFHSFITWAFYSIVAGGVIFGITILASLDKSVNTLNTSMAVVVGKNIVNEEDIRTNQTNIKKNTEKLIVIETILKGSE
jgi:ABC-type lipoprotein release transport system permease subunit